MTIAIDCRLLNASGIGVYLNGCLPYFINSEHKLLLLLNSSDVLPISLNENIKLLKCDIKPFSVRELIFFPVKISHQINAADIFFSPSVCIPSGIKIPIFITIHDIIFPDMPALVSKIGLAARMWFYKRAYKKAITLFTVSKFSRSRIMYHLGDTKPIVVTYSAIQPVFLNFHFDAEKIKKQNTIIFIGNIKKHKGIDCLLEAFILARNEGLSHTLLIIGSNKNLRSIDSDITAKLKLLGTKAVTFTGFISNEQLIKYLSTASLLVQPSLYEGFCLPPLEALVLGTNVLISDIPVLREIYSGFPVTFFEAGNAEDLKIKMQRLLSANAPSPILTDELISKYSFERTASIIMREFNRIMPGVTGV